jgi:lipopolysaccharide biosynthesis glycosyltransferase
MSNHENKNVLCSGIDDNYTWPLLVALFGASQHKSRDFIVNIGYIRNTLSQANREIIETFCSYLNIEVHMKEFTFDYQVQVSHIPVQTYIKLLWLDHLHESFLWLDADTLPLANWQSIFDFPLDSDSKVVIRAVVDSDIVKNRLAHFLDNAAYARAGKNYFNAGIFIGNTELWKQCKFDVNWPMIAANYQELGFEHHDQDILNYLTYQNSELLDSSYNSLVMQGSYVNQKILHFTGQPKPWHFDEVAKNYFSSIELLKEKNGSGAFGGANWLFEYQNYWRHEKAILEHFKDKKDLITTLTNSYQGCRKDLLGPKDKIKKSLLTIIGRKWF